MSTGFVAARSRGLRHCGCCGLVLQPAAGAGAPRCPRCDTELHALTPRSVQRTTAFLLTAVALYVPANLLPVMVSTTFAGTEDDTILSGVAFLYTSGSWPLALIVLVASVMVPIGKLIALGYVLVSIQRGVPGGERERTRLYRLVHIIGKWSMLDVFVVTFTVALVQLQPLMSVAPGEGVLFFCSVVVLTMIAAESLDPRLIWDGGSLPRGPHG